MYFVVGYNTLTGKRTVYQNTNNACYAYELAHEFDAAYNLGYDNEQTGKEDHPVRIAIENKYGEDMWQECSHIRCSTLGLFE